MIAPTDEEKHAPRLLTKEQVATEWLQVSTRKVWSLTASGELPAVRIGRCVRYRPADVQAYIDRLAAEASR